MDHRNILYDSKATASTMESTVVLSIGSMSSEMKLRAFPFIIDFHVSGYGQIPPLLQILIASSFENS